jgi:gamma-glutamyl-gamma-aminobutyrate hydrolase PuuD
MRIGSVYYNDPYFGEDRTVGIIGKDQLNDLDLLVFWGGSDINPQIYGEKNTNSHGIHFSRDSIEVDVMRAALGNIPILGVCRGAQLACALLGGSLYQDVNNHTSTHNMVVNEPYRPYFTRHTVCTSSLHHQMMRPTKDMEIVAHSKGRSTRRISERTHEIGEHTDPEIVLHRDKKVLMVQGHPEYLSYNSDLTQLTIALLDKLLGVKL